MSKHSRSNASPVIHGASILSTEDGRRILREKGVIGFANGAFVYEKSAGVVRSVSAGRSAAHEEASSVARNSPRDAVRDRSDIERSWDVAEERLTS